MISDRDFAGYLDQMRRIEIEMAAAYRRLAGELKTDAYKLFFTQMADAEDEHLRRVEAMRAMFEAGGEPSFDARPTGGSSERL